MHAFAGGDNRELFRVIHFDHGVVSLVLNVWRWRSRGF
jgi:hypothetical protein